MSTILTTKFRIHNAESFKEGFNEDGSYNTEATYEKLGVNTKCKWCEFADKPEICDKGKK